MTGMGELLPPRLPPLNSLTGSFAQASSTLTGSIYSPSKGAQMDGGGGIQRAHTLAQRSLQSNSMLTSSLTEGHRFGGHDEYGGSDAHLLQQGLPDGSLLTGHDSSSGDTHGLHPPYHHHYGGHHAHHGEHDGTTSSHRESPSTKSKASKKAHSPTHIPFSNHSDHNKHSPKHGHGHGHHHDHSPQDMTLSRMNSSVTIADTPSASQRNTARRSSLEFVQDLQLLVSRPFALPFESKNCLVQVYISNTYDENVYLKVVTSGISPQVLCERPLQIDKAYEVVNAGGNSSHLIHGSDNEDLGTLSALLINMFQEADDDGSGE
jgi:hypothetical protein